MKGSDTRHSYNQFEVKYPTFWRRLWCVNYKKRKEHFPVYFNCLVLTKDNMISVSVVLDTRRKGLLFKVWTLFTLYYRDESQITTMTERT